MRLLVAATALAAPAVLSQTLDLLPLPEPHEYGNVLITRQEESSSQLSVPFSHWSHRRYHTCRVCHFELGFVMAANVTEITEEQNRNGQYCGACHNGEIAFDHGEENCIKCHNGGWDNPVRRFADLQNFPKEEFGNEIDWTAALDQGLIAPEQSLLDEHYEPVEFKRELDITANWALIPPAEFPHDVHMKWLDCGDCHPGIFNVKVKSTMHFEMKYVLEGRFCGVCHLSVAFPLNNCKRCHPGMHR